MAPTPYRAWCEASVRRRGRNADHKRLDAEPEHIIENVPLDLAFSGERDPECNILSGLA